NEYAELLRHVGEAACIFRVSDAPTASEHGPRQHNVLTDAVGPATELFDRRAVVDGEGPLRNECALVERLRPLDGRNPVEVVPLLHSRDGILAGIAYEHRARDGSRRGWVVNVTLDKITQRVLVQIRIGVERDDQVGFRILQTMVERGRLTHVDW